MFRNKAETTCENIVKESCLYWRDSELNVSIGLDDLCQIKYENNESRVRTSFKVMCSWIQIYFYKECRRVRLAGSFYWTCSFLFTIHKKNLWVCELRMNENKKQLKLIYCLRNYKLESTLFWFKLIELLSSNRDHFSRVRVSSTRPRMPFI